MTTTTIAPEDNTPGRRLIYRFVDVPIDVAGVAEYSDKLTEPCVFVRAHVYTDENKLTRNTPLAKMRSMARVIFECDPAMPPAKVRIVALGSDIAVPRVAGADACERLDVVDHPLTHRPIALLRVVPRGTTPHDPGCIDPACLACGFTATAEPS
jgi:hypothetical protein